MKDVQSNYTSIHPTKNSGAILATTFAETNSLKKNQRGWDSGEGKTYHKAPPQKRFWTPPLLIRFPPPFVHALSFSSEETGTDQTNPIF